MNNHILAFTPATLSKIALTPSLTSSLTRPFHASASDSFPSSSSASCSSRHSSLRHHKPDLSHDIHLLALYSHVRVHSLALHRPRVRPLHMSTSTTASEDQQFVEVALDKLKHITVQVLKSYRYNTEQIECIADVLLYAEMSGNSQGLAKLTKSGTGSLASPNPDHPSIDIVFESPIAAKLEAKGEIGMMVMKRACDMALQKVKAHGIGIVGTVGSCTGTGAIGYWAERVARRGYIAVVFSGSTPMVAPYGSKDPLFGTNPFAYGIPTVMQTEQHRAQVSESLIGDVANYDTDPIVFDMSSSAAAYWAIKGAELRRQSIPDDIAIDMQGDPTTDPSKVASIRPFDRGPKGSAIALWVEFLCGPFVGGSFAGFNKHSWGNLVMAVDPGLFQPAEETLAQTRQLIEALRHCNAASGFSQVFAPGDRSRRKRQQARERGTLILPRTLINDLERISSDSEIKM